MSTASIKRLLAGQRFSLTNEAAAPLALVFQAGAGSCLRTTLAIGQSVELCAGETAATVYMLQTELPPHSLELVVSDAPPRC